jgi:hypothetical protein
MSLRNAHYNFYYSFRYFNSDHCELCDYGLLWVGMFVMARYGQNLNLLMYIMMTNISQSHEGSRRVIQSEPQLSEHNPTTYRSCIIHLEFLFRIFKTQGQGYPAPAS